MSEDLIAAVLALGFPQVGRSFEGRPIVLGRFGPAGGSAVLVLGGVHGDEPSGVEAALDLCRGLGGGRPAPQTPVWVLPALNPDGLVRASKNSARDVDLNRNFPASNFRREHQPGYFPGASPLCEPETQALATLIDDGAPGWAGVVALHAPLACVNYDGPAAAWAQAVAAASGWPVRADIGYPTPGSLGSWLGRDRGLPVLTIELPGGPYAGFRPEAQAALQTAINPERIR